MLDFTLRRKITRIIIQLADTLHVDRLTALRIFYSTETCRRMHHPEYEIHYQSDTYLVNDVMSELRERQG